MVALATFGIVGLSSAIGVHLLFFYTDVVGIAPAAMSGALLLSRIWDVVNDPLAGFLSDNTRTRWGRRKIYLVLGAVPLGLASAFLWRAPAGLSPLPLFFWILTAYVVFDTFFTLTAVPYDSLTSSLSLDYDERSSIATWNSVGALAGYMVGAAGVPAIARWWGDPRSGFAAAGIGLGVLAAVGLLGAGLVLKEPPLPASMPKVKGATIFAALGNRPFRWVLGAASIARLAFTIMSAGLPYYVTHWLRDPGGIGKTMGVIMGSVALFIPFWRWAIGRWDKERAYTWGLATTGLTMGVLWFVPQTGGLFSWSVMGVLGAGLAAHWVVPTALIPDTIDWDEHRVGMRREGAHFGLFGLLDKIARTLGILALGWGLTVVGYRGEAPSPEALTGFRLLFCPGTGLLLLTAAMVIARYPLTRAEHNRLRDSLDAQRRGTVSAVKT